MTEGAFDEVSIVRHTSPVGEGPLVASLQASLLQQLSERNKRQGDAFRDLIHLHSQLVRDKHAMRKRNEQLEEELTSTKEQNRKLEKELRELNDSVQNGLTAGPKIAQLEKKLLSVQEDLTNSYKIKMEDAQAMLQLNKELKECQSQMQEKDKELKGIQLELKKTQGIVEEQGQKMTEKDVTIQVLKDELQALQLELVRTEEKAKMLDNENHGLLQRYLALKEKQVEFMNSDNLRTMENLANKRKSSTASASSNKDLSHIDLDSVKVVQLPSKHRAPISAHSAEVTCVAYSKNGTTLASGSSDNSVKLWDAKAASCTATLHGCLQSVMCVEFSENGEQVLGSSNENAIRLWNAQLGRLRLTMTGHTGKVFVARFTPNNSRVMSGSHDRSLKLWDLNKGYCVKTIFCFSSCNDLCMTLDGRLVCSGHFDNHVRMWDSRSGDIVHEISDVHSGQITSVRISPDGGSLLTNSRDNTLKLFDIRTWQVLKTFSHEGYRNGMNWNRACFSADGGYVCAGSGDQQVYIWNSVTGKLEKTLSGGHHAPITAVAWHPDGGQLVSCDTDKTMVFWE